jgi:hypothetical protein
MKDLLGRFFHSLYVPQFADADYDRIDAQEV